MQLNPTEIHGFRVEMGLGPNPKGNGKAINVWLTPATPENQRKMKRAGKHAIQGCTPVSLDLAKVIEADPLGPEAEHAAVAALQPVAKLAKLVNEA